MDVTLPSITKPTFGRKHGRTDPRQAISTSYPDPRQAIMSSNVWCSHAESDRGRSLPHPRSASSEQYGGGQKVKSNPMPPQPTIAAFDVHMSSKSVSTRAIYNKARAKLKEYHATGKDGTGKDGTGKVTLAPAVNAVRSAARDIIAQRNFVEVFQKEAKDRKYSKEAKKTLATDVDTEDEEETVSPDLFVRRKAVWIMSLLEQLDHSSNRTVTAPEQKVAVHQLKTDLADLAEKLRKLSLLYAYNAEDTRALQAQMDALSKNLARILGGVPKINPAILGGVPGLCELGTLVSEDLASLQHGRIASKESLQQPSFSNAQIQELVSGTQPLALRGSVPLALRSSSCLGDAMGIIFGEPKIPHTDGSCETAIPADPNQAASGRVLHESPVPPDIPTHCRIAIRGDLQHQAHFDEIEAPPLRQYSNESQRSRHSRDNNIMLPALPQPLPPPILEPTRNKTKTPPSLPMAAHVLAVLKSPEWDFSMYEPLEYPEALCSGTPQWDPAGLQHFYARPLHPHIYHSMGMRKVTLPPSLQGPLSARELPELDRRLRCPFVLVPREDGRHKKLPPIKQHHHRKKQDPGRFTVEAVLAEREHRATVRLQEEELD